MHSIPLCKNIPNLGLRDLPPLGLDSGSLAEDFLHYLTHNLCRDRNCLSIHYSYQALALSAGGTPVTPMTRETASASITCPWSF